MRAGGELKNIDKNQGQGALQMCAGGWIDRDHSKCVLSTSKCVLNKEIGNMEIIGVFIDTAGKD